MLAPCSPFSGRLAHLPAVGARRPATRVVGTNAAAVGREARMVHDVRAASAIILPSCYRKKY